MENNESMVRTHRVGSVTAGLSMIVFGILFLIHLVTGAMNYTTIFSFWPIVLIGLGIELFLSNFLKKKIVYDKAAVLLLITMALFAMLMALIDVCIRAGALYMHNMM